VLGGIVNPVKAKVTATTPVTTPAHPTTAQGANGDNQATQAPATPAADATAYDVPWVGAVLIGSAAIIVCAVALAVNGPHHPNAAPALTALATAFGALFLDTSKITHVPNGVGSDGGSSDSGGGSADDSGS
jgi:hypothetical protein